MVDRTHSIWNNNVLVAAREREEGMKGGRDGERERESHFEMIFPKQENQLHKIQSAGY